MSESAEQVAVVANFRWRYPNELIYAVPNGAFLNGTELQRIKQAKRLKAEGLEKGIPDLCIPVPRGKYHGMYVEMKVAGSTLSSLSANQKKKLIYLRRRGYYAIWCAGLDQANEEIEWYMEQ